jgi:ribosomal protein S6E (S10)
VLPIQARPPKRTFDEVDQDAAEEPNSDEVYGWIEDDGVATEGLLVDDVPNTVHVDIQGGSTAEGRSTKLLRTSTV